MADLKISELDPLSGAGLAAKDELAIVDVSASETKKIQAKDLIQAGIQFIDDGSIPGEKLDSSVPEGSIGTAELADGSVTAEKLADQSSGIYDTGLPATGAFVGQIAVDANDHKAYIWDGTDWAEFKGSAGLNELTVVDNPSPVSLQVTPSGDGAEIQVGLDPTNGPGEFLAGPAATGGDITQRRIVGVDLPTASATEKGAIFVNGNGLTMDGDIIAIDNAVTPSTIHQVVTYDAYGLVTGGRVIEGADLPPATDTDLGVIRPAPDLTVDAGGLLTHTNQITAGEGVKVTFDGNGHITGTQELEADDIPEISADKIVGGELTAAVIADRSIEEIKLADYSTCYIQEGNPGTDPKLGQFWFTPSTNQLRVYGRGSGGDVWLNVGFGALQANNLRWGGTIDAATGKIGTVTQIAVAEGLKAGDLIPAPTDALSGMYFVTQVEGNQVNQPDVINQLFTPGDWLLCINEAQGYVHIDAGAAGGGGGGGATYLGELFDVDLGGTQGPFGTPRISLADKQYLMYDAVSGMWVNSDVIDGGSF